MTPRGLPVTGNTVPFSYIRVGGVFHPDPPPADRDLFHEWPGGTVCRHSLLGRV